ncbi:MAG: protein kinase domain-containing protein [Candidatus Aminicenantes bacterium]
MERPPDSCPRRIELLFREISMIGKTVGKFKILQEIGRGGMGVVYKAIQISLNRMVALKMLPAQMALSKEFLERFQREARILARLAHQNIVHIYDLEELEGTYFIIMEYVEGQSLAEIIARQAPLPVNLTKKVGIGVASALSAAHKSGIIHRDIKPENIMIDKHGATKVMDFGIARAADESFKTRAGVKLGTPEYMSPEQAKGLAVDAQSDIYSLGIVLYEMATSRAPFTGEDSIATALKHIHEPVKPPSMINSHIPENLEHIILNMLEKDKNRRVKSPAQVIQALEEIRGVEEKEKSQEKLLTFVYCPDCGSGLKEDFLRCPQCGSVVRRQCPHCRNIFDAVYNRCPYCSQELPVLKPQEVPQTVVEKGKKKAFLPGLKFPFARSKIKDKRPRQILEILKGPKTAVILAMGISLAILFTVIIPGRNGSSSDKEILPSSDSTSSSSSEVSTPGSSQSQSRGEGLGQEKMEPDKLEEMISLAQDYFERGAYDLCVAQMEKVLKWESRNVKARDYILKAKQAKPKVESYLRGAREALGERKYHECMVECEKILAISPKHPDALELMSMARAQVPDQSILTAEKSEVRSEEKHRKEEPSQYGQDLRKIRAVVDRQRRAMETEDINLLLQDMMPELTASMRRDAEQFFAQNDILRVSFDNIKIDIVEPRSAEVTFISSIVFIPDEKKEPESQNMSVLWHLKKMGPDWKIAEF